MKTIILDPSFDGGTYKNNFNKVIGSRHLEMAHRELGVEYLSCHGLISGSPDLCSWANQPPPGQNPNDLGVFIDDVSIREPRYDLP